MSIMISLTDEEHKYLVDDIGITVKRREPVDRASLNQIDYFTREDKRVRKSAEKCDCAYCDNIRKVDRREGEMCAKYDSLRKRAEELKKAKKSILHLSPDDFDALLYANYFFDGTHTITRKTANTTSRCDCTACRAFQKRWRRDKHGWQLAKSIFKKLKGVENEC